ncbi:hypothetical protein GDO86_018744 [Hymenochirus boettgeri]|uniref:Xylose isomerase-like TIM barrel domain-containing protein n=1 Tax=Hymenochirus boettgeri TaxID=247094 RepID=A0A8T2IPA5_9PIPI|nr:hypothetical protein GDO86_018744 [Hymenochirus boettgeri]
MATLRFSANISWLFPEVPDLPGRVKAASDAGFNAVEVSWPYHTDRALFKSALDKHGVKLVLINTPPGNIQAGELGLGAVPGRQDEFQAGVKEAVKWAGALGCGRIHIMQKCTCRDGKVLCGEEMEKTFIENLKYAADILGQGHVQIAQVPHRNEPDSPGELNFMYLFDLLLELGYQGYVGCEYKPHGDTLNGLGWMKNYQKKYKAY